jgi:hypothetical protein
MPRQKMKLKDLTKLKDTIGLTKPKVAKGHEIKRVEITQDNARAYKRKRDKPVKPQELE